MSARRWPVLAIVGLVAGLVGSAITLASGAFDPAGCTGAQFYVDKFYTDRAFNGGQPNTFDTGGKAVCLTQIATYHWNEGTGAAKPGTITLTAADGSVIGEWGAAVEFGNYGPGFESVPANWVATVAPPVLLNGPYTVRDSDPGTWSFSELSGGLGFIRVWGVEYVQPATASAGASASPLESPGTGESPVSSHAPVGGGGVPTGSLFSGSADPFLAPALLLLGLVALLVLYGLGRRGDLMDLMADLQDLNNNIGFGVPWRSVYSVEEGQESRSGCLPAVGCGGVVGLAVGIALLAFGFLGPLSGLGLLGVGGAGLGGLFWWWLRNPPFGGPVAGAGGPVAGAGGPVAGAGGAVAGAGGPVPGADGAVVDVSPSRRPPPQHARDCTPLYERWKRLQAECEKAQRDIEENETALQAAQAEVDRLAAELAAYQASMGEDRTGEKTIHLNDLERRLATAIANRDNIAKRFEWLRPAAVTACRAAADAEAAYARCLGAADARAKEAAERRPPPPPTPPGGGGTAPAGEGTAPGPTPAGGGTGPAGEGTAPGPTPAGGGTGPAGGGTAPGTTPGGGTGPAGGGTAPGTTPGGGTTPKTQVRPTGCPDGAPPRVTSGPATEVDLFLLSQARFKIDGAFQFGDKEAKEAIDGLDDALTAGSIGVGLIGAVTNPVGSILGTLGVPSFGTVTNAPAQAALDGLRKRAEELKKKRQIGVLILSCPLQRFRFYCRTTEECRDGRWVVTAREFVWERVGHPRWVDSPEVVIADPKQDIGPALTKLSGSFLNRNRQAQQEIEKAEKACAG